MLSNRTLFPPQRKPKWGIQYTSQAKEKLLWLKQGGESDRSLPLAFPHLLRRRKNQWLWRMWYCLSTTPHFAEQGTQSQRACVCAKKSGTLHVDRPGFKCQLCRSPAMTTSLGNYFTPLDLSFLTVW